MKFMILSFCLLLVVICLLLVSCDAPLLFWEKEALEVVDDVLDEEAELKHGHGHESGRDHNHNHFHNYS